ncbi:MAG: aminotransferase class IV [Salinarchaeum sp.]
MVLYHVNGDLVPKDEATVSVRDRGFMYGDAAFETLRVYNGTPFALAAHLDRLAATCRAMALDHGLTREDLRERIETTIAANDVEEAYCKLSISRGPQPGTVTPDPVAEPTVVVYVAELPRGGTEGTPVWSDPATVEIASTQVPSDAALPADAKTHNYLPNVIARANHPAADEVLMGDAEGHLLEGAASNVFFVREETIHTPEATLDLLPGITRDVVLDLATPEYTTVEGTYHPDDLADADEVFLTNSTWEIRPVTRVDDRSFAVGPVTRKLIDRFNRYIEDRHY